MVVSCAKQEALLFIHPQTVLLLESFVSLRGNSSVANICFSVHCERQRGFQLAQRNSSYWASLYLRSSSVEHFVLFVWRRISKGNLGFGVFWAPQIYAHSRTWALILESRLWKFLLVVTLSYTKQHYCWLCTDTSLKQLGFSLSFSRNCTNLYRSKWLCVSQTPIAMGAEAVGDRTIEDSGWKKNEWLL